MGENLLPEGQQVYEGLEMWLKARRDEQRQPIARQAIDALLDEVREDGAEGWLPWQKGL
jgi:hypothetical protein